MTRIYTKNGDNGSTFLLFGEKVAKNDIRVECYDWSENVNWSDNFRVRIISKNFLRFLNNQ